VHLLADFCGLVLLAPCWMTRMSGLPSRAVSALVTVFLDCDLFDLPDPLYSGVAQGLVPFFNGSAVPG
jgi:hypothetical protein